MALNRESLALQARVRSAERVRLGIEDPVIEAHSIFVVEQEVEVLKRFGEPEGL